MEVDPDRPVLVDKYLDRADELDVDALCDKDGNVVICGIMQHIEQAGVHSGAGAHQVAQLATAPLATHALLALCAVIHAGVLVGYGGCSDLQRAIADVHVCAMFAQCRERISSMPLTPKNTRQRTVLLR